jgi:hypothetical protein
LIKIQETFRDYSYPDVYPKDVFFSQGTSREHSGNMKHSGNIQRIFSEHSGSIQGTFREHSEKGQ